MFVEQVDVGDFLRFKSCVLYTEHDNPDQPLIYVEVVAHVTRPEMRSSVVSPSKLRFQRAKFFYLYLYRMILCLLYYLRKSNYRRLIISFSALSTWIWASVHNGCLKISLYWLHIFCLFLYNMKQVSNTFYFTFTVRPEAKATKNGFRLRNVVPATEEEARRVLERMDAEALQRSQSI